jgi:hypothetical protein
MDPRSEASWLMQMCLVRGGHRERTRMDRREELVRCWHGRTPGTGRRWERALAEVRAGRASESMRAVRGVVASNELYMPGEPVVGGTPGDGTGSLEGMCAGDALGRSRCGRVLERSARIARWC